MSKHIVKVLKAEFITPHVKRFVVEKPQGYSFVAGQATEIAINRVGLEEEVRPFSFTSVNEDDYLEFIIKIYADHDGITKKLGQIQAGDELIVHDVFGTISYRGPGLFIAGGAGITPFISIFRNLKSQNKSKDNTLLFANRRSEDIILAEELRELLGKNFISILEKPVAFADVPNVIDSNLVKVYAYDKNQFYYICGSGGFTYTMSNYLTYHGIDASKIITEK